MRKLSICFVILLTVSVLSATGQDVETRTVTVDGLWENISLAGTQNIHFAIGPADEPITVIGTAEDIDNLVIENRGGTLTVNFKRGYRSKSRKKVNVYVKNPNLKKATVSGTGTINITGELDKATNEFLVSGTGKINVEKIATEKLSCTVSGTGTIECPQVSGTDANVRVSGTGTIKLDIDGMENVSATSSGTGNITLTGQARTADLKTSGTGNIKAQTFTVADLSVLTSGTGSVYCTATDTFDGRASGTGTIYLYGNPVNSNYSGSARKFVRR